MSKQISITLRRVARVSAPGTRDNYQVFQAEDDGSWSDCSKLYPHSTSAFAALGRLNQKDVLEQIQENK